jgi:hypothetical protein
MAARPAAAEQSFANVAREFAALSARRRARSGGRAWLIAQHRHDEMVSDETAKQAHDSTAFLIKARDQYGLSHLQPTFRVRPSRDAPFLWFAPLDT